MHLEEALGLWAKKRSRGWCSAVREHVARLRRLWLEAFGAETEVGEVTGLQVEAYEAERDDGKRSASALNQERIYLGGFFRWARDHGLRVDDPVRGWKHRRVVVRKKYRVLTREEEDRLCAVASEWLRRFVRVAVCTGLREGTIRALRQGHLKGGVLEIPPEIVKTRDALRLPLPERALEALRGQDGEVLVPLPTPQRVCKAFKAACKRAGIAPAATPHDLRRTWVARLVEQNVPMPVIQKLGGWRTVSTILNHYVTAVPDAVALEILERV